ncbi:tektin-3-like isoform X1 [Hermetia illucens]|nr:tektin-3-like isoform X1 [Hermetia illucens]
MKWHASSYLENRLFDSRLVKENLLDKWNIDGEMLNQRRDFRQFQENYPWSSGSSAAGPPIPTRAGIPYQTALGHPWKPTFGCEITQPVHLPQPIHHQMVNVHYNPSNMSSEPLKFPNLVTGYDTNPQHAARTALYTRFTPGEWSNHCLDMYSESNENRNNAERLRAEAVRTIRETDEKTAQGQRDAGRRLGERLTDVTFWRNELNTELEKLISETAMLCDTKRDSEKALADLDAPLHIARECLYNREKREGVEMVHDHVEKNLILEVDNLRNSQQKLRNLLDKISRQLAQCRASQHELEQDLMLKESALGIDGVCHKLNNYSRGINYFASIEKYDPTLSTADTWASASSTRINRSQSERTSSAQLRSEAATLINSVSSSVWDHWINTNNALNRRAAEMSEAKSKMQLHLHQVQQEIFDMEKHIALLRKAIDDKSNPLKVAQTRLEARSHRPGLELCKDFAQVRLVREVCDIQDSVANLHQKLQRAEEQHQQLLMTRANLEADMKRKINALFLDREKCMGIRRTFPASNIIKY